MFNVVCECGKTTICRKEMVFSWVERKCKSCKSHMTVYQGHSVVYNFNNEKERREFRYSRKLKRINFMKKLFQVPVIYYPPPPPSSPVGIISDVFMGYPFPINDIELEIIDIKNPVIDVQNDDLLSVIDYTNDYTIY